MFEQAIDARLVGLASGHKCYMCTPCVPQKRVTLPALSTGLRRTMQLLILLGSIALVPTLGHAITVNSSSTTANTTVNLLLNYDNGTLVWYNGTSVPTNWNFFNVTNLVTNGNIGGVFFASFGSHFIYSINGVGCPASNIFCDEAWGLWTLDGICWDMAQVGVDRLLVSRVKTVAWFLNPVATFGEFPPTGVNCLSVSIDVKPGDNQTVVNVAAQGTIPVAILSTSSFDAAKVNPMTVRFGRTGTEASPVRWSLEDVDGDGTLDMVLHFNTQATGFQAGDTMAILMGRVQNGTPFRGSATIEAISK